MVVEFDPEKNARNVAVRGLSFNMVDDFDWPTAVILEDSRQDYGEVRLLVFGRVADHLYLAVVTPREKLRVISLRRANRKEVRRYEEAIDRRGRTP